MTTITCPECGEISTFETMRRTADEFCPKCDFPLFWAKSDHLGGLDDGSAAANARRRLPGTGGRVTIGSIICPECTEHNALQATHCSHCGADLDPQPEPEPEPEPEPLPPPPPPRPPSPPAPTWPLWAAVAGGTVVWVLYLLLIH